MMEGTHILPADSTKTSRSRSKGSRDERQQDRRDTVTPLPLLVLLLCSAICPGGATPIPDSSDDRPSRDNALEMLVVSSGASSLPSLGGGGGDTSPSGGDLLNYYLPVIMAEMAAPVSTRDPSIIRVSCRGGFKQDPSGGCRSTFVPTPYYPRQPRPSRHASVASILPMIRSPPRVPRPQPQTQRDLIRQFNTSRRRPAWFGRALNPDTPSQDTTAKGPDRAYINEPVSPLPYPLPQSITTTTTTEPPTTTPDCDD